MDSELRKLQLVELDILKQVLSICEKHNLKYYMLGGTLLGAVRHQGFIPWDDDIDIGMPRPDYEKLLAYAKEELEEPYALATLQNGKDRYYYARVINTKTKLLRTIGEKEAVIEAWIDIFPLDGVPKDKWKRKLWYARGKVSKLLFAYSQFSYFRSAAVIREKKWVALKKLVRFLFVNLCLESLLNTKWCWKRLDKALKSCDYESSDMLINFMGYWGNKEMFSKKVYGEGKLYPFEDIQLMGPEDADFVLTQMYGDYMTPPKNADKDHHGIKVLEV